MRRQLRDPRLRACAHARQGNARLHLRLQEGAVQLPLLAGLARDDVELVTDGIAEITATGLRIVDGRERQFDCIIWSTGFQSTKLVSPMRVVGAGGQELGEVWRRAPMPSRADRARVSSMFLMYGPNTNTSGGSIIFYLETQATYIRQALEHLRAGNYASLDVRPEVEAHSDRQTQSRFAGTAWTGCDSWYRDGHGRNVANWPGYRRDYLAATQCFDPAEYAFSR
jgi:cation diffusion facilitator CzcD-associated flavoprotein CzcO